MEINAFESIPTGWDDARDLTFFRITAGLFTWDFCFGASVLLAANDVDDVDPVGARPREDLVPVAVRRTR